MRDGQKRDFARQLRSSMSDAESSLWRRLRCRQLVGHRFRRQLPIGPYIVDFACIEAKLIVEVDGGQHGTATDGARDAALRSRGFQVVHFWNNDVLGNMEGVCEVILRHLRDALPPSRHDPASGAGRQARAGSSAMEPT
jgi:very-short-patch-repair endonuclease